MNPIDIPSLVELEQAYRRVALGKATGLDGIFLKYTITNPVDMARLTHTMLMKACTHGQEDLTQGRTLDPGLQAEG